MPVTVKERLEEEIKNSQSNVFVRKEFESLGNARQINRALAQLIEQGLVVRAGYGVYVRTRKSSLSDKMVPTIPLLNVGIEALKKLGIQADVGSDFKALREGRTTQVPMATVINVGKSRIRRKIALGSRKIVYETN